MKQYDFDTPINRHNTSSLKWDEMPRKYPGKTLLPMWVADMDFRCADEIVDALVQRANHGVYGYSINDDAYFDAIIGWYTRRHNVQLQREWLVYTPGVVPAINWSIMAFSRPGDKVVIQPPVYGPFTRATLNNGRHLVENHLINRNGRYEIDFDQLDQDLTDARLLILCSPQNPSGRSWSLSELTAIANLCEKHNVLVVSDEIHCDLLFKGVTHTPFFMAGNWAKNNSIVLSSPSKTFNIAGLNCATAVIPGNHIRKQFAAEMGRSGISLNNVFAIEALKAAYNHGDAWLDQAMAYVEENARILGSFLAENIPDIRMMQPSSTYLVWLDCTALVAKGIDVKDFFENHAGVAGEIGTSFGKEYAGFYRLNLGCPRQTVMQAMQQINDAWQKLPR